MTDCHPSRCDREINGSQSEASLHEEARAKVPDVGVDVAARWG